MQPPTYAAQLWTRTFQRLPVAPPHLAVERMAWNAWGGPELAVLSMTGDERALWSALDLLRCPIEITPHKQTPCWWGYIATIDITIGMITVGVTLDTMANRVQAVYSLPSGSTRRQRTTTWQYSPDSQAEYGVKDARISLSNVGTALAEQHRLTYLLAHRYPPSTWSWSGGRGELQATITCRGWYDTLGWRYVDRAAEITADTSAHIRRIATAAGQFLTGMDIETASGVTDAWGSTGDSTARDEIDSLLGLGNADGGRMLATITRERVLHVTRAQLAARDDDLRMDRHGQLWSAFGTRLPLHTPVAGRWLQLRDVPQQGVVLNQMVQPLPRLIRRVEVNVAQHRLLPEPWEQRFPWEDR